MYKDIDQIRSEWGYHILASAYTHIRTHKQQHTLLASSKFKAMYSWPAHTVRPKPTAYKTLNRHDCVACELLLYSTRPLVYFENVNCGKNIQWLTNDNDFDTSDWQWPQLQSEPVEYCWPSKRHSIKVQ